MFCNHLGGNYGRRKNLFVRGGLDETIFRPIKVDPHERVTRKN